MRFLSWIYDALAVIGASAIGLLIVAVAADFAQQWYWRTFREDRGASVSVAQTTPAATRSARTSSAVSPPAATAPVATPVESTPPAATPVATKPELPPSSGVPWGLEVAEPNGRILSPDLRLRITVEGRTQPGSSNAWVETHSRNLYLLVSQDSTLLSRPPRGTRWALRLTGNRSTGILTYRRADGERFAYVRLCRFPDDHNRYVTTLPSISADSARIERRVQCH